MSELTHTVEALLFVASEPLTPKELAELTDAAPERIERALGALADRHCEGRSGVVLERVMSGSETGWVADRAGLSGIVPACDVAGPDDAVGVRDGGVPGAGDSPGEG